MLFLTLLLSIRSINSLLGLTLLAVVCCFVHFVVIIVPDAGLLFGCSQRVDCCIWHLSLQFPLFLLLDSVIAFPVVIVSAVVLLVDGADLLYGPFVSRLIGAFCF